MKMKWFDRVLLALILIVFLAVGVFTIGIAIGPLRPMFEEFYALMTNGLIVNVLILVAIGLVMLFVSFRVIYACCAKKSAPAPTTVLLKTTDSGAIHIAISAIDSMVQRSARTETCVRDVVSRVITTPNEALAIQLRITFAPDTELAAATAKVQENVRAYVEEHTGVPVQEVQVLVEAVGNGQPSRVG